MADPLDRPRSRRRWLAAAVALVGLGAIAWLLLGGRRPETLEDETPREVTAPETSPELRPADPVETTAPAPGPGPPGSALPNDPNEVGAVSGTVVDARGSPVPEAVVYLVRKGTLGTSDLDGVVNATTDAGGRFRLRGSARGHWIGAVDESEDRGLVPAHADGDAVPAEGVRLVMEDGGRVVVVAKGQPPDVWVEARVETERSDDDRMRVYPTPEGRRFELSIRNVDGAGEAALRIGTQGPVRVSTRAWKWVGIPTSVRLPAPSGRVEFRMVPSAKVDLQVFAAPGGRPFDGPINVRITDAATDERVEQWGFSNPDKDGFETIDRGLPPGTYRFRVWSQGYSEWTSDPVRLEEGGSASVVARLEENRDLGTLVFALSPPPPGERTPWYAEQPKQTPSIRFRKHDAPEQGWAFDPRSRQGIYVDTTNAWDAERREMRLERCLPGTYDVMVWDHPSWSVGFARGVSVTAGATTRADVALVGGRFVVVSDLPGIGAVVKRLEIRAGDLGALPLIAFPAVHTEMGYDAEVEARGQRLGPYPFGKVVVRYEAISGAVREHVVGE